MSKRAVTIDDLLQFKLVGDPQIHPTESLILFGLKTTDEKFKSTGHLHVVDFDGNIRQLTQGEKGCGGGRWVPGGKSVSFVSGRATVGDQLFVLPENGEASQITKLDEGSVGGYEWSPNGQYVAFTHRLTHPDFTKKATEERKENGKSEPPLAFESTWYRLDGDGYFGEQRYKLYLLHVDSGEVTLLSDQSAHGNYSFSWSPNSDKIAVIRSAEKEPFVAKPNDQVYILDLKGNETQIPNIPKGNRECLKWSPSGEWLVFAGNDSVEDPWGALNARLYKVHPDGSGYECLTPTTEMDLDVGTLSDTKDAGGGAVLNWLPDSSGLISQIGWHGGSQVAHIDIQSGEIKLLTSGDCAYFVGNLNGTGRYTPLVYGDANTIPEIAIVDCRTGESKRLTHFNEAWTNQVELSTPEGMFLEALDGTQVHTWILKPSGFDPTKKYPAILEVHGGPHAQYGWVFFHEFQLLAAQGYVVVYSNPRGSKGYGENHCNAIRGDWGNKDWVDVQTVVAWMKAQPYVDTTRLGIMGGSYGGYMTNWAIGHTDEFRAAITDRCVSNLVSMAGNSDFPFNKDGYFRGVAYGSLQDIEGLWQQSPIAFFDKVKTPTLIIHSEGDLRCNIEQSEQVFVALKMQGIETRFVRYPKNTSHGMSRSGPADLRMHRLQEIVNWWKRQLA
ncbi:MAG: S9 family peptidase [Armatimonadetes bacterium]|nr:S9 family peptidase [Armatimonadota bacterium]